MPKKTGADPDEVSRRGRRNRQKGKEFERAVALTIADHLGLPMTEVWGCRSGRKEADIQLSQEAYERLPYWLEVKNAKTLSVPAWLRQAHHDASTIGGKARPHPPTPVVVFKQHGSSKMYAIIDFGVFLRLAADR